MGQSDSARVHVVTGGFPPGQTAGHDMDYARLRLLQFLQEGREVHATVANDFSGIEQWLADRQFLITYVAGPYLNDRQNEFVRGWLEGGGRWLALHGSSGGKAARLPGGGRKMEKGSHHETLGALFIHHPPLRRFRVDVADRSHPLTKGLPESFEVMDELYFLELDPGSKHHFLLTTELPKDPTPSNFLWVEYDHRAALLPDGKTRVLGYTKDVGKGGVAYFALGHCHSPSTGTQPFVDASVSPDEKSPATFRGSWETEGFQTLIRNGIDWGICT